MHLVRIGSRFLVWPVIAVFLLTSLPLAPARAAFVGTEDVLHQRDPSADRMKVAQFLQREDVRQQLTALGVDPKEVDLRVASLSDEEVGKIAGKIDQLPAGQGAVGAILFVGLIVFLVLLITDILGVTHVFSFVRHK